MFTYGIHSINIGWTETVPYFNHMASSVPIPNLSFLWASSRRFTFTSVPCRSHRGQCAFNWL